MNKNTFLSKLTGTLILIALATVAVFSPALAASNQLPEPHAFYEDSLASRIDEDDTSFTLTRGTSAGTALASSTYAFVLDEGSATEEIVIADCTGTVCTNALRGVSLLTGTSSVSSLQNDHRRGATVKITDSPFIQIYKGLLSGQEYFEHVIGYYADLATTTIAADERNFVNVELLNDTAFNGAAVVSATETARGVVEIATGAEAAAGTTNGGSGRLALPASIATATGGSANTVPITGGSGTIDDDFIPSTIAKNMTISGTLSVGTTTTNGSLTLSGGLATSNIASSSLIAYTSSTSPSTTWPKPLNLKYIVVEVVGSGGGGHGGQNSGTDDIPGGGGGAGAYCKKVIPASALGTTETVVVPVGGSGGSGSNNGNTNPVSASFGSFCTASNGGGGVNNSLAAGGTASGGDLNISGGSGQGSGNTDGIGGMGGSNPLGPGGGSNWAGDGGAGAGCGGGGGGGGGNIGGDVSGGTGATGCVLVHQFFY